MWTEHGQSDRLINMDMVVQVQLAKTRDAINMYIKDGGVIMLEYNSSEEAIEAYRILRFKLQGGNNGS